MTALVIGLGNPTRGDDGLGPEVARRVAELASGSVDVVECADPASLMDVWAAADHVVVVDAMTSGRDPGAILVIDAIRDGLPIDCWSAGGTHALGLSGVVDLARALDRLPKSLIVVGIEMDDAVTVGVGLTDQAAGGIDPAAEAVLRVLDAGFE